MRNLALAGTLLAALSLTPADAASVGFRQTVIGPDSTRPINVTLWYPSDADGPLSIAGENPAFVGTEVVKDAPIGAGKHPLVLLSHGYRGNWRNLNWLAAELVHAGYAVAAPDHPATTSFDWRPDDARKLWLRPNDVSRVIDDISLGRTFSGRSTLTVSPPSVTRSAAGPFSNWRAAATTRSEPLPIAIRPTVPCIARRWPNSASTAMAPSIRRC